MTRHRKIFSPETDKAVDDLFSPTEEKESSTVPPVGAFCGLKKDNNFDNTFCKHLECEDCSLLKNSFPRKIWLCSNCRKGFPAFPYWADTECEKCGIDVGVMVLCQRSKTKKSYPTT